MDFGKLSSTELADFLTSYGLKVPSNNHALIIAAEKLYHDINRKYGSNGQYPLPIVDLYLATNLLSKDNHTSYSLRKLTKTSVKKLSGLLDYFQLPHTKSGKRRLIHILTLGNAVRMIDIELPQDIYYNIALSMDYLQLIRASTISKLFANYCHDDEFWKTKAMRDFKVNAALYDKFFDTDGTGRNVYIHLAAIATPPIPIPGVERYNNINIVLDALSTQSDINRGVLLYFYDNRKTMSTEAALTKYVEQHGFAGLDKLLLATPYHSIGMILSRIGVGVANNGSMELLLQYIELANSTNIYKRDDALKNILYNVFPAVISNNNDELFEYILSNYSEIISYREALETAAAVGNLQFMNKLLLRNTELVDLNDLLLQAAKSGNPEVINKILSMGATNYDSGLEGAAAAGNLQWVQYFIAKGATDFNTALYSFINGGSDNVAVLQLLTEDGLRQFDINDATECAMPVGKLRVIKYLAQLVPERIKKMLSLSITYDMVDIFKELITNISKPSYEKYMNIALEGNARDVVTYLLKYTTRGVQKYFTSGKLRLEQLRYMYDNYPELVAEWSTHQ